MLGIIAAPAKAYREAEARVGANPYPWAEDAQVLVHLRYFTDGSGVMTHGWPRPPAAAGWGFCVIGVTPSGEELRLGEASGVLMRECKRPTSGAAELSAVFHATAAAVTLAKQYPDIVHEICADNIYAMHTAAGLWRATCDVEAAHKARRMHCTLSRSTRNAMLHTHVKGHAGHWANEMADRMAEVGRTSGRWPADRADHEHEGPFQTQTEAQQVSTRVCWTMLLQYVPKAKAEIPWLWDIAPSDREIRVATANVQTMNPKDEHRGASWEASARRTALAMQFKANGLDVIGIQEGRSRIAGRCEIEGYHVLRGQASPAGQYGCELWVSAELCPDPKQLKVLKEQPRMLMVSGPWVTGRATYVVGHAPSSFNAETAVLAGEWWKEFKEALQAVDNGQRMVWMIDANAVFKPELMDPTFPPADGGDDFTDGEVLIADVCDFFGVWPTLQGKITWMGQQGSHQGY